MISVEMPSIAEAIITDTHGAVGQLLDAGGRGS